MKQPKTLKLAIEKHQKDIKWYEERIAEGSTSAPESLAEEQTRLKDIRRLWRKFSPSPLIQQLAEIVDGKVEHYFDDFYYHDLMLFEKFGNIQYGLFVHDCGTHIIMLEGDKERVENQQEWLTSILQTYGTKSDWYLVDMRDGKVKKLPKDKPAKFQFKIVETEPVGWTMVEV